VSVAIPKSSTVATLDTHFRILPEVGHPSTFCLLIYKYCEFGHKTLFHQNKNEIKRKKSDAAFSLWLTVRSISLKSGYLTIEK